MGHEQILKNKKRGGEKMKTYMKPTAKRKQVPASLFAELAIC